MNLKEMLTDLCVFVAITFGIALGTWFSFDAISQTMAKWVK